MAAPIGIYVRVSRKGDREDERFHSPREQAERATALVRAKGLAVGPVFEDIDVSGATEPAKRPAMGALLREVKDGKLGGVAAYSLDRLSREPAHGDELVRAVTKAGGLVLTPDIPDAIDSPTGEFTFGMLLQVAKLYRSQAGARFASAKERSIKAGIPVGSVPVGYRKRPDRTVEVDPATAPAVRTVFERRAKGAGYTELAQVLDEATGRKWTRQGVARVLRNRFYATGRLEYGDIVSDVVYPAIVDEPLWQAAQVADPRPRAPKTDNVWLLTGLARCATCGHAMGSWRGATHYRRDPRRGKMEWVEAKVVPTRYRCINRKCPDRASVNAPRLERFVVMRSAALADQLATAAEAADLGAMEEALTVAERRLAQVLAPEARDALGDLWAADVKLRRAERDAAAATLGAARAEAGVPEQALKLSQGWEGMTRADLRAALGLYWKEVKVHPKDGKGTRLTLVARGPHAEVEVGPLPDED